MGDMRLVMPCFDMAIWIRRVCLAVMFAVVSTHAVARQEVVVVTSFPMALYEPFRRAFEQREPNYRLRILNRKTTAAIAMVATGRFEGADVFWASSPDAFEVLKAQGKLVTVAPGLKPAAPVIGGFPVDDPDGFFRGFSVSGYGVTWSPTALAKLGIAPPVSIAEMTDPRFHGLIAMSSPSRSGTTHLMVETVLQRHGWERGWEIWLGIAGNLATITARSFSVSSGVAQGRFAIGLSIDFLGRGQPGADAPVFAYPRENVFLPASIAVLNNALNREGAHRFAAFVLSGEGQALLSDPRIARQPAARLDGTGNSTNLFTLADERNDGFIFNARMSGQRYELVNILFDELITERLVRLQRFWRIHGELGQRAGQSAILKLEHEAIAEFARRLPRNLPHDLHMAEGSTLLPALERVPRGVPPSPQQAAFTEAVRMAAETHLSAAERRLDALARALGNAADLPSGIWP